MTALRSAVLLTKFASRKVEQRRYIKGMKNDDRQFKRIRIRARVGARLNGMLDRCYQCTIASLGLWICCLSVVFSLSEVSICSRKHGWQYQWHATSDPIHHISHRPGLPGLRKRDSIVRLSATFTSK